MTHRPQDDLPYEVRMKFIIHGYRKLLEKLEYIEPYTRRLEKQNQSLREQLSEKGVHNKVMSEKLSERKKEEKQLKKQINILQERIHLLKDMLWEAGVEPPPMND